MDDPENQSDRIRSRLVDPTVKEKISTSALITARLSSIDAIPAYQFKQRHEFILRADSEVVPSRLGTERRQNLESGAQPGYQAWHSRGEDRRSAFHHVKEDE
jgi:hypothetical protein